MNPQNHKTHNLRILGFSFENSREKKRHFIIIYKLKFIIHYMEKDDDFLSNLDNVNVMNPKQVYDK
jgi:hypothetical protein